MSSLSLKLAVNLTEIKHYGLANIKLCLALVQVRDDIRRVVPQELSGRLEIFCFGFCMLSLKLINCRALSQATLRKPLLQIFKADTALSNYQ